MPNQLLNFDALSQSGKFRRFCKLLSEVTGIQLVFVDPSATRREFVEFQREQVPLCSYMRSKASFQKLCRECDQRNLLDMARDRRGRFYLCHAGLVDLVVPVYVAGEHVGTFMGGQVLPDVATDTRFERFWQRVDGHGFDRAELRQLFFAAPCMGEARLHNLLELVSLFAEHISELGSRILETDCLGSSPVERACAYISVNLQEPFSLTEVGLAAGVAPSYLSSLFSKEKGETFVAYVRRLRIEHAQKLLLDNRIGLARVAIETGFGSLRSFNRAFRQVTNQSPSQWRTAHQHGALPKPPPARA